RAITRLTESACAGRPRTVTRSARPERAGAPRIAPNIRAQSRADTTTTRSTRAVAPAARTHPPANSRTRPQLSLDMARGVAWRRSALRLGPSARRASADVTWQFVPAEQIAPRARLAIGTRRPVEGEPIQRVGPPPQSRRERRP